MSAYYNEHDPFAAAWLRNLIAAKLIADGEVDGRSITDIEASDLRGFTQCHFFAGIGVWSHALRGAGWSDAARVWTGSCPCQSFSSSGKREGFSDKRHLWPAWFRLIRECKPDVCFGEQVASQDGLAWFDVVSSDMEGAGYTIGAADLCAAGFGAPHIRQRLYFVADSRCAKDKQQGDGRSSESRGNRSNHGLSSRSGEELRRADGPLAQPESRGHFKREHRDETSPEREALSGGKDEGSGRAHTSNGGNSGGMGEPNGSGPLARWQGSTTVGHGRSLITASGDGLLEHSAVNGHARRTSEESVKSQGASSRKAEQRSSLTNGFWADAEWLYCRDEKFRPVEPGTFPLAHGATNRVGRLRGYGNALNAEVAKGFIEAYISMQATASP